MSSSLPERPDLDQLRRQAKEVRDGARKGDPVVLERVARQHPSAPVEELSLAAAQLVIARELGFSSWPTLKAAVHAATAAPGDHAHQLVAASIDGRPQEAAALLHADPELGGRSLLAAVVLGDADSVRASLAANPEAALAVDDERGWPPLLYACYSPWHQIEPVRAAGLADVIRLLLDAGASPNTNNGAFRNGYRSTLKGAVEVNNPDAVEVLLDAGANPDDGRCIEQAADGRDPRCLELLLARGARVTGTWALGAPSTPTMPRQSRSYLGLFGPPRGKRPARPPAGWPTPPPRMPPLRSSPLFLPAAPIPTCTTPTSDDRRCDAPCGPATRRPRRY